MDEIRFRDLETRVSELREERAALKVELSHLNKSVNDLSECVTELVSTVDRSKGALWIIGGASGFLGALGHWAASFYGNHNQ